MSGSGARTAVGVALAAALLAGCGSSDQSSDDSASPGGGSASDQIDLPEAVGDLKGYAAVCAALDEDQRQRCTENAAGSDAAVQAAAENLSGAYDGASAVGAEYVADDFNQMVRVLAVAAPSPGLWTTDSEVEAARQHLGHPREWVEESDGVQCLARTVQIVPEGEQLDPADVVVSRCQRSDADLTVMLVPSGETTLEDALAWTGQVFGEVTS